jgi:hypothetical protein
MFYYSYAITNCDTNKGSIQTLEIDISRHPNTIQIDTTGLRFKNDGYTEKIARRRLAGMGDRLIPVGFLKTPPGDWDGAYTNDLTADFSVVGDYILQGKSLSGFMIMSKGLPGIRRCVLSPYFNVDTLFADPAEDTTITGDFVDSIRNVVKFYDWTIGPTAPSIDFIPTIWCDTLLSYTRQSSGLGWLLDKHTEKKIEHKINLAKRLLKRAENCISGPEPDTLIDETLKSLDSDESLLKKEYGNEAANQTQQVTKNEKDIKELNRYKNEMSKNPKERKLNKIQCKDLCEKVYKHLAIRTLQSLVREVEILNKLSDRNKKQYLTSEAYALLKYNTEYLIEQLKK